MLDPELLAEFAKLGVYCQFDLFGIECSYYQFNTEIDMPSDAVRLDNIVKLVNEGYLNRILMSHDIHTKHRLVNQAPWIQNIWKLTSISSFKQMAFGGHGFGHILNNVLPRLVTRGLTDDQVDTITTKNPAEWLQFNV